VKTKAKNATDVTVITSLKNAEKGLSAWDNDLVEGISKFNLKPTQLKLVMLLSSKIKKDDIALPVFKFRTSELVKVMGFTGNNGYHLKKLLEEMRGKTIRLQRKNGGWSVFGWIVSADVDPKKPPPVPVGIKEAVGVVKDIFSSEENETLKEYRGEMERQFLAGTTTIKLDERITPFLIALTEKFTEIELKYILGFKSVHAIQLYILAKRFGDTGWREDDEFALRGKLSRGEYKDWVDFKRRVLLPAIEEVNKTDIRLQYTKTGSTIRLSIRPAEVSALSSSRRDTPAARAAVEEDLKKIEASKEAARVRMEEYRAEAWARLTPEEQAEKVAYENLQGSLFGGMSAETMAVYRYGEESGADDKVYQRWLRESEGR